MRNPDPEGPSPQAVRPLTPRDYLVLRKGLLFEFWGLLYFPLLSILLLLLSSNHPLWPAVLVGTCYALVLTGLLLLLRVCEHRTYRLFLGLASGAYLVSGGLREASRFVAVPPALEGVSDLLFSVAALLFVLGLQRLVAHTRWWEGARGKLKTDILMLSIFWVGWDVLALGAKQAYGQTRSWLDNGGLLFLVLVARIATLVHVWRTLKALHQDAGLRNNVLVIRNRRRLSKRPLSGGRGSPEPGATRDSDPPTSPELRS
jgi:hypothetical protein